VYIEPLWATADGGVAAVPPASRAGVAEEPGEVERELSRHDGLAKRRVLPSRQVMVVRCGPARPPRGCGYALYSYAATGPGWGHLPMQQAAHRRVDQHVDPALARAARRS
jgi:hypothetical protein